MATTTFALARFSAGNMGRAWLVTLALAGAVAVASPVAADPTGIAVVESLTGNLSGVEFMDYVHAGQVIRLGPHQTIVLRATAIVAGWSSRAKRPMSGGESFAAQRTDRVRVLQRFRLATSPLYQNQRDRRRPNTNW
jgi:hypothetical protein